nr:YbiU family protein [Klebsiella pneumoniae]
MEEYTVDNTTKCSVFRTFQGWTALSVAMRHSAPFE